MSEMVFTAVFIASSQKISGVLLSVTLRAASTGDALYQAERELMEHGYYNIEHLSVCIAEDDSFLGIKIIDNS
ncbi:hypothetical protein ACLLS5_003143 [Salmonella enterica]|nr:hypothetical protein [Salmonella enterica]AIP97545.1 hypothetical protein N898_09285 [Salmonella enterica subsp. arizonae serovar 62:z36:- str. RKS2983]AXC77740.1 hypothetical protein DOE56_14880 [Salmonella enterica subsp. arizonae serovar 63:g,z51:-]EAN8612028.1 hypothetical protein [Salmonella enterica subsp. arizonae serovar 48:z4,z24:-]EAO5999908.1 hypothetical protein [Salmonella enterica subsp. arizonae serovar 62:z36:-]EAT8888770.1 hypothetical protein [Salmonella enterica subsp. ar